MLVDGRFRLNSSPLGKGKRETYSPNLQHIAACLRKNVFRGSKTGLNAFVSQAIEASEAVLGNSQPEDPIEIGIFGPPHGIQGGLRLFATSESLQERLEQPGQRWAQRQKGRGPKPYVPVVIQEFRATTSKGGQHWLVKVEGIDSIEEAELLRGHVLSMSSKDRPEIDDEDEFYAQELIGMQVFLESSKKRIGLVADIYSGTGSHDLLHVKIDDVSVRQELGLAASAMVPFVKEIVPQVDRGARRLEINPPEGLLNIQGLLQSQSTPKKKGKRTGQETPARARQKAPISTGSV